MNLDIPRLRMFAGPNGSGKSTIKEVISEELLGVYINPDEIEKEINQYDFLDLDHYDIQTTKAEILEFFAASTLLQKANLLDEAQWLRFNDNKLSFFEVSVNSYFASVCADFIRKKLLESRKTFTFETVMSSPDKIELLSLAQKLGYRTYLYYIATNGGGVNLSRVENRVKQGGHSVPKDKISSRYYRSLDLLVDAVKHTNRAYIFDNSNHVRSWICEITDGKVVTLKQDAIPGWFYDSFIKKVIGTKDEHRIQRR